MIDLDGLCHECGHPWAAHTEVTNDGCQYEGCYCDERRPAADPAADSPAPATHDPEHD